MKPETFMHGYNDLKAFFDEHGHCNVKAKGSGKLGHFVSTIRTMYRRQHETGRRFLSDEWIADLKKINFIFSRSKCAKSEKFKRLVRGIKSFRKLHNHVNVDCKKCAMPEGYEDLKELVSWARNKNTKLGRKRVLDLQEVLHFSLEPTDESRQLLTSDVVVVKATSSVPTTTIASSSPSISTAVAQSREPGDEVIVMPSDVTNNPGGDGNENGLTNVVHEKSRVAESSPSSGHNVLYDGNPPQQERSNHQATKRKSRKNKKKDEQIKSKPPNLPLNLVDINSRSAKTLACPQRRLRSATLSSRSSTTTTNM